MDQNCHKVDSESNCSFLGKLKLLFFTEITFVICAIDDIKSQEKETPHQHESFTFHVRTNALSVGEPDRQKDRRPEACRSQSIHPPPWSTHEVL